MLWRKRDLQVPPGGGNDYAMSDAESRTREERIYEQVLRMVLRDEREEDVFLKLEVNGFTGDKAKEMFEKARAVRMSMIRRASLIRFLWGVFWFSLGATIFVPFWFGAKMTSAHVMVLFLAGFGVGVWKMTAGVVGFVTASQKRGSVLEDE